MPKNILDKFNINHFSPKAQINMMLKKGEIGSLLSGEKTPVNTDFSSAISKMIKDNNDQVGTDLAYKKVAKEFEKETLAIMWNIMASTVEVDPLFGGGKSEELFRSELIRNMVHEAYSKGESKIAENIYKSLKRREALDDEKRIPEGAKQKPG
ncbi:MAG: hypothetical protein K0Q51_540 [Rickettsiaceae bacterium]|jgi:hypothetical protein|nr:hypothetical protein [Rickettsiaceae bacterium]